VIETPEWGDWHPISPTATYVHDTLSAVLHPRRACAALAGALRAHGVGIGAQAPQAQGAVIWATGWAGLTTLRDAQDRPAGVGVKGQAALLRHDAGAVPQIFAEGIHVIPHDDGTVAVGSTTERAFDRATTTDAQLDALVDTVRGLVPALADAPVVARWAGVRPRARSRAPILGPIPGQPGHFVANGGFKIGFGMAPKVAEVMADLVLEGRDTIPDAFRLTL